eukprot:7379791-Prymnesium_polylepis.1
MLDAMGEVKAEGDDHLLDDWLETICPPSNPCASFAPRPGESWSAGQHFLQPHMVAQGSYPAPAAGMMSAYAMPAPGSSLVAQYMCASMPHKFGESSTSPCWGSHLKGGS